MTQVVGDAIPEADFVDDVGDVLGFFVAFVDTVVVNVAVADLNVGVDVDFNMNCFWVWCATQCLSQCSSSVGPDQVNRIKIWQLFYVKRCLTTQVHPNCIQSWLPQNALFSIFYTIFIICAGSSISMEYPLLLCPDQLLLLLLFIVIVVP